MSIEDDWKRHEPLKFIEVCLTEEEYRLIKTAADKCDMDVADFIMNTCMADMCQSRY